MEQPQASEESSYSSLYKYSAKCLEVCHQKRVDVFLSNIKEKRHKDTDKHRDLSDLFFENSEALDTASTEMELELHGEVPKAHKILKFKLMQSEWFTEIPEDLSENWMIKFCPSGVRVLVVAKNHRTVCYTRNGKSILTLKTNFPGGGIDKTNGFTLLDCVLNKSCNTLFVLDCISWNSMSMLESEASLRFYWLETKFKESPELLDTNRKYKVFLMEHFPAQIPLIQDQMFNLMETNNMPVTFDGVAFYHKEGNYTLGMTPLVGFLSSFMLPEKLHIDVDAKHMQKRPENYVSVQQYIEEINARKKAGRSRRRHRGSELMEAENCDDN